MGGYFHKNYHAKLMSDYSEIHVPEDWVAELLAEAARLHSKGNEDYSLAELQQICSEARISPRTVKQALRNHTKVTVLFFAYVNVLFVGIILFFRYASVLPHVSAVALAAIALYGIFISIRWLFYPETFMSSRLKSRISEDMAAKVIAEAARLHTDDQEGYSLAELQQACSEAGISPHAVDKAFRKIEEKRRRKLVNRRKRQKFIERHAQGGVFTGIGLLFFTALSINASMTLGLVTCFCMLTALLLSLMCRSGTR